MFYLIFKDANITFKNKRTQKGIKGLLIYLGYFNSDFYWCISHV